MAFYWFLFLSASLISILNLVKDFKYLNLIIYVYSFIILLFLSGFKYASIDYFGYFDLYTKSNLEDASFPFFTSSLGTTGMEFIWAGFSAIFYSSGVSFEGWIFFIALISLSIKFYFFKKWTPYFLVAIVLYISLFFSKDMGQLRNGLAAGILLFAVRPIVERKLLKFLLVVLVAFGVQAYAIIALPLYWFYILCIRFPKSVTLTLIFLAFLSLSGGITKLIFDIINTISIIPLGVLHKLDGYTSSSGSRVVVLTFTGIVYLTFSFIFLFFKDKILTISNEFAVLGSFYIYGLLLFLMFTGIDTLTARSLNLFSDLPLVILMLIPFYLIKGFGRLSYLLFVFLFGFLTLMKNINDFEPYQNVLFVSWSLPPGQEYEKSFQFNELYAVNLSKHFLLVS